MSTRLPFHKIGALSNHPQVATTTICTNSVYVCTSRRCAQTTATNPHSSRPEVQRPGQKTLINFNIAKIRTLMLAHVHACMPASILKMSTLYLL